MMLTYPFKNVFFGGKCAKYYMHKFTSKFVRKVTKLKMPWN